jgi:hypothetical protein
MTAVSGAEGAVRFEALLPEGLDLIVRPMADVDVSHITANWAEAYLDHAFPSSWGVPHPERARASSEVREVARRMVMGTRIEVAALREAPEAIVAWRSWATGTWEGKPVLHFILVKRKFRRLGVFRWWMAPFATVPLLYTHETKLFRRIPVPKEWSYRPLLKHH